ncbi:MAG: acyl-CoA dehydrogenase [Chloroflexi bacterium]|nr:MAG: acyl-CoA dehydrogenase [Chloroflexota bacterium]TME46727.1 MAG: acyl-CoA dehydrogenase [Chloroflexota bacterium]
MTDRDRLMAVAAEAARRLNAVAQAGEAGRVNRQLIRALADEGLLGRVFPASAGGKQPARLSAVDLCLVREGLARESTAVENALTIQALGAYPIVVAGSDEQIRRQVIPAVRGEAVAAFALTEPDAGTDAGALALRAERVAGGYRLSGVKAFISNAPDADFYTLFARTTPDTRSRGITAFIVAGQASGLKGTALSLISDHPIGRLELDGVFVPDGDVLGDVNHGFAIAMRTLDLFRASVGANAIGMAQAALDAAVAYAGTRLAFGRPIKEFQAVSHRLAEMATRLEAARALVYSAAEAYDRGEPSVGRRSAMAKLFATETAQQVIDASIQVHGAVALERGHLLEHLYREVRAPRIYEGTSEIQREIIARDLFRKTTQN